MNSKIHYLSHQGYDWWKKKQTHKKNLGTQRWGVFLWSITCDFQTNMASAELLYIRICSALNHRWPKAVLINSYSRQDRSMLPDTVGHITLLWGLRLMQCEVSSYYTQTRLWSQTWALLKRGSRWNKVRWIQKGLRRSWANQRVDEHCAVTHLKGQVESTQANGRSCRVDMNP